MKVIKRNIILVLSLTTATVATHAKQLPDFMNDQQLCAWRAQHSPPVPIVSQSPDDQTGFFTGKPYDTSTGSYIFLFRNFSPSLIRWSSADPSGFPNGANNFIYAPVPTRELDRLGLYTWYTEAEDKSILTAQYNEWKFVLNWDFAAAVLAHFCNKLGPADYNGSPEDAGQIRQSKEFRTAALQTLKTLYGSYTPGYYSVGALYDGSRFNPAFEARYTTGDLFNALGGAHFWYQGILDVTGHSYTFSGTMQQVDLYTFETVEAATAAWLGFHKSARAARDLQFVYNYHPFLNKESWTDSFTWE